MSTNHKNNKNFRFQIKSIELLNSSLQLPAEISPNLKTFNFNVNVETRAEEAKNLLFFIVHVDIKDHDQSMILGSLSASCIYEIDNLKEILITNQDGSHKLPDQLTDTLNKISISTTRGLLFSTLKGTFLHNAILPII